MPTSKMNFTINSTPVDYILRDWEVQPYDKLELSTFQHQAEHLDEIYD